MRKILCFILFILTLLIAVTSNVNACTIFTVEKNNKIIVGNNEDYYFRHGRALFLPVSEERKHGLVLFGLSTMDTFGALGGINDHGLFIDYNALKLTDINIHKEKKTLTGGYLYHALSNFSTVKEVIEWANQFDMTLLRSNQIHVSDKTGDAAILGLDSKGNLKVDRKSGSYLLSTNFRIAQGRDKCWRYDIAEKMLNEVDKKSDLTVDDARKILDAASLSLNVYASVFDLKNGIIKVYSLRDYRRSATINLSKELEKGKHSLDIEKLVSIQAEKPSHSAPDINLFSWFIIAATTIICLLITFFKLKYKSFDLSGKFLLLSGIIIILITILSSFFKIPYSIVYLVLSVNTVSIVPILIFSTGIMFRPWISFVICSLGSVAGVYLNSLVSGSGQEVNYYMITMLISYGLQGPIISLLRKRNEIFAMIIGAIWTIVTSTILGLAFMYLMLSYLNTMMVTLTVANILLTNALIILFIPLSLLINKGLRVIFKVKYLDELL